MKKREEKDKVNALKMKVSVGLENDSGDESKPKTEKKKRQKGEKSYTFKDRIKDIEDRTAMTLFLNSNLHKYMVKMSEDSDFKEKHADLISTLEKRAEEHTKE